jgi:hypothetical protein
MPKPKKILTDKEKQQKFLKWIKDQKESANGTASGGGSSWNWAYSEAMDKVYNKARSLFSTPKIEEVSR